MDHRLVHLTKNVPTDRLTGSDAIETNFTMRLINTSGSVPVGGQRIGI